MSRVPPDPNHLLKIGAVALQAGASVSLNEGRVTVRFAPANRVTVAAIRSAIRRQGFTSREAEVRVSGMIEKAEGGATTLLVPGSGVRYTLAADGGVGRRLANIAAGTRVSPRGEVAEDVDCAPSPLLVVLEVGDGGADFRLPGVRAAPARVRPSP